MNKAEIEAMAMQVFDDLAQKENEIIKNAKRDGIWGPGLDANKELFVDAKREAWNRIQELRKVCDAADE